MSFLDKYPVAKARLMVFAGFYLLLFLCIVCAGVYTGARRIGQELGLIRKPPPPTIESVALELSSPDIRTQRQAWRNLPKLKPDRSRREMAEALISALKNTGMIVWHGGEAARSLAKWGGPEDAPALEHVVDGRHFHDIRFAAIEALAELGGPEAVRILTEHLVNVGPHGGWTAKQDREKARAALIRIGPPAEKPVLKIALDAKAAENARITAVQILGRIGGRESETALPRLTKEDNLLGNIAKNALEAIRGRQ